MEVSAKSDKLLRRLGVTQALAQGRRLVQVGPVYELRRAPGSFVRMVFHQDEQERLCIGYARHEEGDWILVESEPFSMRSFGYYDRRLKRIGDYAGEDVPRR
jgi:hypothetical protein